MSHYYLDASALVKRYVDEVGSEWLHATIADTQPSLLLTTPHFSLRRRPTEPGRHRRRIGGGQPQPPPLKSTGIIAHHGGALVDRVLRGVVQEATLDKSDLECKE